MKTFHSDEKLKQKYVKRVEMHYKADEIIKGKYWEGGKGCCVGCIVEQCNNPHQKMQELIGTPLWLNYLVDRIFENLPNGKAKEFPLQLIRAIPVGKNIDVIYHKFYAWLLEDVKQYVNPQYDKGVLDAINKVIDLHLEVVAGKRPSIFEEESAAWSAAASAAASAAESAVRSAAVSAAVSAARSAGRSAARSAAESAAGSAAYVKMSEKLIELLQTTSVTSGSVGDKK